MHPRNHLENAYKKQQLLRDRVTGIVEGYETGLLIFGPGGFGKSYIVDDQLAALNVGYRKINSHITPLALFRVLEQHCGDIIVLEDCECLLRNTTALGILRSATFPSGRDRLGNLIRRVDYYHGRHTGSFVFGGRIILLTNRGLADMPEAEALATRIRPIEFKLLNAEVGALMRDWAVRGRVVGGLTITPDECGMIVDFVIDTASQAGRRLNLRMMENAIHDYLLDDGLHSGTSWRDLVTSAVHEQPSILDATIRPETRAERRTRELDLVRSLGAQSQEDRLAAWHQSTGKSQATFYRRLGELAAIDHQLFD